MKEAAIVVQYKLPSVCLIAHAGPPSFSDMHGVFLTGGKKASDTPIVLDTDASISITPFRSDIVSDLEECDVVLHGLSDTVKVEGIGWVEWSIQDTFRQVAKIRTHAYLVPEGHVRLFSPQADFKLYEDDEAIVAKPKCEFDAHWLHLHTVDGNSLKLPFDSGTTLPYMFLDSHSHTPDPSVHPLGLSSQECGTSVRRCPQFDSGFQSQYDSTPERTSTVAPATRPLRLPVGTRLDAQASSW